MLLGSLQIALQPAPVLVALVTIQIAPRAAATPLHSRTGIDTLGHIAGEEVAEVVCGVVDSAKAQKAFCQPGNPVHRVVGGGTVGVGCWSWFVD